MGPEGVECLCLHLVTCQASLRGCKALCEHWADPGGHKSEASGILLLRPLQVSMWLRSQTLEAYSPGLKSSMRTNLLCGLGQMPPSL